LADTSRWLTRPEGWDHNGGDGPSSDKRLARVVFTTTVETAIATGWLRDRSILSRACERLLLDQSTAGSWSLEGEDAIGSPAAYGRPLATYLARQCLFSADPARFRSAIERADAWLSSQPITTVTDASVCLLASATLEPTSKSDRPQRSLDFLRRAQSNDGGWGPHATSPPEPFDTALVLLALMQPESLHAADAMMNRGRAFLLSQQQEDGSWIETTRPPGNVSYAQRISTTGWVTLALIATSKRSPRSGADPKGHSNRFSGNVP
jgi:hypothetical protein